MDRLQKISSEQILKRVKQENPWWEEPHSIPGVFSEWTPRPYLDLLAPLVEQSDIRRAVVLMGPRRVGKTVMIHHMIDRLLKAGVQAKQISYISVDHPIYNGLSLEDFLSSYTLATSIDPSKDPCYLFFDEIQYLKDWEKHLKSLVDSYPNLQCLVSGSAAAALRFGSTESGAGRFTDFLLPPLTFHEYLFLLDQNDLVRVNDDGFAPIFETQDITTLNEHFVDYLNFGGYPEVVFSEKIRSDPGRFIKSDIIDKVLLRDLPQLYGIQDIQELNYLFTNLAFNSAGEFSLAVLCQNSGVAKNTIKKYIQYLETAFLIKVVNRVDRSAKRFKRAAYFKIYLTNPSIWAALFSPVSSDDPRMSSLVETAIFSQWFHSNTELYYASWKTGKKGEVDIVSLNANMKPGWAVEVKWSDRYYRQPGDLRSLAEFCLTHNLSKALVTTQTITGKKVIGNTTYEYTPASLYCYLLGYNIVKGKQDKSSGSSA